MPRVPESGSIRVKNKPETPSVTGNTFFVEISINFFLSETFGEVPKRAPPSIPPKPKMEINIPDNKPDTLRNFNTNELKSFEKIVYPTTPPKYYF